MKDRKYSDTSDAFLCDILSKKCNQFLNSYTSPKSKQFMEINQTVKFTTNQVKTTKTIMTKNKIVYSNIITQSTIREVAMEQTQQLRKKEQQLLGQLMRHIIQNIKLKIQDILMNISSPCSNKDIFKTIVLTLEEEFQSINEELNRVRRYTKRKEIRDVLNLQINSMTPSEFIELVFCSLPTLKEFFISFDLQILTNQEIDQLKQQDLRLIYQLVDLNQLIDKRQKIKKLKKKNKKKKSKCKQQAAESTNQASQKVEVDEIDDKQHNEVAQFLLSMVIGEERLTCHSPSEDWIKQLRVKYVQ